jgi:glycosyltransferase involved in cell wall biosynthesis
MIRVLHVTNAFPNAAQPDYGIFIKEQIDSLDPSLVESRVLVIARGGGIGAYLASIPTVRRAAAWADLVHCHHMLCGMVAILALLGRRSLVSFMSDGALNYKGRPRWLGGVMFRLVSRFSAFNIYKSSVPKEYASKSALLPNGVDLTRFTLGNRTLAKSSLDLRSDCNYVLFVSAVRLDRREKRYDFFRLVVGELKRRHPGRYEELIMSRVERQYVPLYFQAASVHLLTSDVEGSPNSIKEALATGTPVVARNVGSVATLIDSVTGCEIFEEDDVMAVADMVERAVDTRSDEVRHDFLRKDLSNRAVADRLQALYLRMLEGR